MKPAFLQFVITFIQFLSICYPCQNDYLVYIKQTNVSDIDGQYSSLLITKSNTTLFACISYVGRKPHLSWFVYNAETRECVTSQCWVIPVQDERSGNNIYYRRKGKPMRSCSDVKTVPSEAGDGEYWMYPDAPTFLGCPTKIYCHNMDTGSPTEYVSLNVTNTGVSPQLYNPSCNGEQTTMENGDAISSKIRVDVEIMKVIQDDYTFASWSGTHYTYGEAWDCYASANFACGPRGTFQIDTRGTGMFVDPLQEWQNTGWEPYPPSVVRSADGVQIDLQCGGLCGGCIATEGLQLHRNPQEELGIENADFAKLPTCCT